MTLCAMPMWVMGAFICLFGSTLTALGLVLQKYSHNDLASEVQKYFLRKWWLLGFSIFMAAQIINMIAMAMTPQVVLSCLGSWTLVCNTILAHVILKESISRMQTVGVAGLVVATAMVLYNAPQPSTEKEAHIVTANEMAARFLSPGFELLTAFFCGLGCIMLILVKGVSLATPRMTCAGSNTTSGHAIGTSASIAQKTLLPTSWAMAAAIAAGYTALLFKCIAVVIAGAMQRPDFAPPPWYSWKMYVIVGVALTCAPTELHCLNLALQLGDAAFVVPTYLSLGMLAQLLTGAIFFNEFCDFQSASHALGFGFSVLLTLTFVILMAKSKANEDMEQDIIENTPELQTSFLDKPQDENSWSLSHHSVPRSPHNGPPRLMTPRGTRVVSYAGFGGAIECLESTRGRATSGYEKLRTSSCPP